MLIEYIALDWPECRAYLERIAAAHGKQGRDISPHLYDLWLDCLLRAVIGFLKSRYEGPLLQPA